MYHTAAKYHNTALDIWGNDAHQYCTDVEETYLKIHQESAMMLTFYYSAVTLVLSFKSHLDPILNAFGLDFGASLLEFGDQLGTPWG